MGCSARITGIQVSARGLCGIVAKATNSNIEGVTPPKILLFLRVRMQIAIIGSGHVGLVAAACFAEIGHQVICVDNDAQRVRQLCRGAIPFHEQLLPELLVRYCNHGLTFTTSIAEAVKQSAVVFIAVGTPAAENGETDMSFVESVAREIAGAMDEYKVIVEKSTVPVYTNEWVRHVMSLNGAVHVDFDVASNPEFLREGTAVTDFLFPDRIVIGADSPRSADLLQEVYRPLLDGSYQTRADAIPCPDDARVPPRLIVTSTKSAELIKHASNAFLATKISFINAVANICEAVGANVEQVKEGIGADRRIGSRFLDPGVGYGGSCFPKDLKSFRHVARDFGYDFQLLEEVININNEQRQRFLRKVRKALWTLPGKRVAVLGLAFKGGTDDIRESPAIEIVKELIEGGCEVSAYDPAAMENACQVFAGKPVRFEDSAYQAMSGADALLVLTDWEEFASLDLDRIASELKYRIVIDGRNVFDPEAMRSRNFIYYSVGRPDVVPEGLLFTNRKQARLLAS